MDSFQRLPGQHTEFSVEPYSPYGSSALAIKLACLNLMRANNAHLAGLDFTPVTATTDEDDKFGLCVTRTDDLPLASRTIGMLIKMGFSPPEEGQSLGENIVSLDTRKGRIEADGDDRLPFQNQIIYFDSPRALLEHLENLVRFAPAPSPLGR